MSVIDLKVPTIGESITEVTLSKWLKPDGALVAMDEVICEFESDKATLEFPSEAAGILSHVAKEGDDLMVGAIIGKIDSNVAVSSKVKTSSESTSNKEERKPETQIHSTASPVAANILLQSNLNPNEIKGSGRDGKIIKVDVLNALEQKEFRNKIDPEVKSESASKSQINFSRQHRREKLSRMRRTIAKHLVAAKNETAMLTTFNELDMSEILALRSKYNEICEKKYDIKIGFMSIFAKACSIVLQEIPEINAQIDGDDLIYHDYVDISIAISTPNGLVVPPIRNVESLRLHEFERQLKNLSDKARKGSLSLEEMSGGTFTISNGGVFGSLMSTPIINIPQSAILGMHSIKDRPVAVNGRIEIRPMMYLALSYDHRIIDGSSSVTFLVRVKELLENPLKLFLEI